MERFALSLWFALTAAVLAGCADGRTAARLPNGFPTLPVPAGNTLTEARANADQRLFYDRQVSRTHGISCSDCQGSGPQSPPGVDAAVNRP